ncbi:hypothetical protein [Vagococcus carniphilus]|uniref:hypothetical protein n=1 Tax=Vagococcus carniphilus TaxID=218144 RepID=UPI003B5B6D0B
MSSNKEIAFKIFHPCLYGIREKIVKPILVPLVYSLIYIITNYFSFNFIFNFISKQTNWLTNDYHYDSNSTSIQFDLGDGNDMFIVPIDTTIYYLKTILITIFLIYIILKLIGHFYSYNSYIGQVKLIITFLFGIFGLTTFIFLENYPEPKPELYISYSDIEIKKEKIHVQEIFKPNQNVHFHTFKADVLEYLQKPKTHTDLKRLITIGGTSLFPLSVIELQNKKKKEIDSKVS